MYSRDEKVDMLLIYGECRKNSRAAAALYAQRFPERQHPPPNYFLRVESQFRREEDDPRNNNVEFVVDEETEINVVALVEIDRTTSLRQIGRELTISHEAARKILKKHNYRSFKYQVNQHLYEADFQRRFEFCNWAVDNIRRDGNFASNIIFSDESRFTNLGLFNRQNTRYWAQENQRLFREGNHQVRFGFNVWLGMIGDILLPPIIFDGQLTSERYLEFLHNEVSDFLNHLPREQRDAVFFQQDGAPPHNSRLVRDYLNQTFGDHWIGTNGPVRWPPRSPDLTPLDFHIWAYLKEKVYIVQSATREELEARVRQAINDVTRYQLRNCVSEFIRRVNLCRDEQGRHFENLL